MWRRLSALVMLLLLGAAAIPAATLADTVCNSGEFCVWGNPNYSGDFWDPSTSDPHWDFFNIENDDDSLWNRELTRVTVHNADNYLGSVLYCATPGLVEGDINDAWDNDGDSNLTWASGYTSCAGYHAP